jgi:acetyl esterase/lipase
VTYQRVKLYEGRDDVTLTAYVLDDSKEMLNGTPRPAVLICPGGGYMSCSDREGEPIAMSFAAMGYHAFVLRYSVYNEGKDFVMDFGGAMVPKPHCQFPNPMRDIGAAMIYIKRHAAEWIVDADRIAICGFSAGGHNCAMYSVYWNKPVITEHFGVDAQMLRPAAAVLCYPVTDYFQMGESAGANPENKHLHGGFNTAFFGKPVPDEEQLLQASPARLVDKDTPPMFLWATYADGLVPVQQTVLMASGLSTGKVPFEAHIFESGGHGLSAATQATSGALSEIDADAAKWLPLCDAWLKKRFAFTLPALRDWQLALQQRQNKEARGND